MDNTISMDNTTGNVPQIAVGTQGACPACGYCPHCGRGGQQVTPWYPAPQWPVYPTYPGYPGTGWPHGGTWIIYTGNIC